MTSSNPVPNSVCPGCGRSFTCGVSAGASSCWCMEKPIGAPLPDAGGKCYCPDCLARLSAAANSNPSGTAAS